MGKNTGFMEYGREAFKKRPIEERLKDYREVEHPLGESAVRTQGARCMNCGVPFCQSGTGCPLGNLIPDWNDRVYQGRWRDALAELHATNNFPEFTGRVCPAPCETACVLGINEPAVTIKQIEVSIIDHGWKEGWIQPSPPAHRTGKKVAVVGSGPAGLAAADQLNRAGHTVTVFEKDDRVGGLLTYGIPDFKMEKIHVERRQKLMEAEGVAFKTGVHVGVDVKAGELKKQFDAVVLSGGAQAPRDLQVPGRELDGIHFAMDFLPQQNRRVAGLPVKTREILATGKRVIVIGGGDTGSDCIGTSLRQSCKSLIQFELLPKPPATRAEGAAPWPHWPMIFRTSTSHEEAEARFGEMRDYAVMTKSFTGSNGKVEKLHACRLNWVKLPDGRMAPQEIPGSEFTLDCDLVVLAMGFLGPIKAGLLDQMGVELDPRGNVKADTTGYRTNVDGVFAAGDMRRGQSLVVWAIAEGRQCAKAVDTWLMGESRLP